VSGEACPGSCNARERREQDAYRAALAAWDQAAAVLSPGESGTARPVPPDIRLWPGEPVWCSRCASVIGAQLRELVRLAPLLAAIPDLRSPGESSGRVTGTKGRRSPSPFADDLLELEGCLRDWVSGFQSFDPGTRLDFLTTAIDEEVHWLAAHFDRIIADPDRAADFGAEVQRWHREFCAKAKAGAGTKHQKKKCPRCKAYSLWRRDGEDYIRCVDLDCARMLSLDEFESMEEDGTFTERIVSRRAS